MFEVLTRHLPDVANGIIRLNLIDDLANFVLDHPEMGMQSYVGIMAKHGIEWDSESMKQADVSSLDAKTVIALLVGAMRADHFCEGIWGEFVKEGCIAKWLQRLKEIDEENEK